MNEFDVYVAVVVVAAVVLVSVFSWVALIYLLVMFLILCLITKWTMGIPVYCSSTARLDGKTVIITGGNAGVGYEAAVDLATRGARIVLGCRNKERAEKAVQQIKDRSGNTNVVYYILDLADFDSIRDFVKKVQENEPRLDILINNAGVGRSVVYTGQTTTKQGHEIVFGTNHLGPFLLTYLLLDLLKKSAPSHVINLSSLMHKYYRGKLIMKDGKIEGRPYDGSKLANVMHARELGKKFKDCGIRANSVHPGFVNTEIWTTLSLAAPAWMFKLYKFLLGWIALDCRGGAQTTIYVAVDESAQECSREYFSACQKTNMNPNAKDDQACEELWEETEFEVLREKTAELKKLNEQLRDEVDDLHVKYSDMQASQDKETTQRKEDISEIKSSIKEETTKREECIIDISNEIETKEQNHKYRT